MSSFWGIVFYLGNIILRGLTTKNTLLTRGLPNKVLDCRFAGMCPKSSNPWPPSGSFSKLSPICNKCWESIQKALIPDYRFGGYRSQGFRVLGQ